MIDDEAKEKRSRRGKIENETVESEALEMNLHNDYMQILKPVAIFFFARSFNFNFQFCSKQVTVFPSFVSRETFACQASDVGIMEGKLVNDVERNLICLIDFEILKATVMDKRKRWKSYENS